MNGYDDFKYFIGDDLTTINKIYDEVMNVYNTSFRYFRLSETMTKEECEKKAAEEASKKKNELFCKLEQERLNRYFGFRN